MANGHVVRRDRLLHEIIKGRMRGKPTRGRRRMQMLHDLASDGGTQAAEDRERSRHIEIGCQKPAVQQKTTPLNYHKY